MTQRSEWRHRVMECKARLMTRVAGHLLSRRKTPLNRLLKSLVNRDAPYEDEELQHPPADHH